jgi:RNA polymerase sigma-70 factor (sigma-E family)
MRKPETLNESSKPFAGSSPSTSEGRRFVVANAEGFPEFVAARSPALLRVAWMLTGDAHLAEDLLQTALALTWPHWSRIRAGGADAYVRKVMVRTQGSWWRRQWRNEQPTAALPDRPDQMSPSAAFAAADDQTILTIALRALPLRQRQAVVLRYYEDLPERTVADLMRCSTGAVKSQASQGLTKLRAALATAEIGEKR